MFKNFSRITHALCSAALLCTAFFTSAGYAQDQFLSNETMQKACQLQESKKFKFGNTNQDKQTQVICRDVALVKQIARWIELFKLEPNKNLSNKNFDAMLRKELNYIRSELAASRQVLESLQLKPGEGLLLEPAQWQIDLNGDGKLNPWEKYFFAVVKPGERPLNLRMPSDDPTYYQQHFNLEARFRVDQSDVYWALAYHQFFEGFAHFILSFQLDESKRGQFQVNMIDQASLTKAHQFIGRGLATSEKMRQSLLAETDDELEWIPNPQQKNHVFPLAMNQVAFDLWGQFLAEFTPLWNGKTLATAQPDAGGLIGEVGRLCPAGTGISVSTLFQKAPSSFSHFKSTQYACTKIDAQHPQSGFMEFARKAIEQSERERGNPEWNFLRYFYWVN